MEEESREMKSHPSYRALLRVLAVTIAAAAMSGCASYTMAKNVKLIGYDEDSSKGKSMGEVRGESCAWQLFGRPVTSPVSLDVAMSDVRARQGMVRYIRNVSTINDGFDAVFVKKHCLVVKAVAYR
jgi:hypothetical protein